MKVDAGASYLFASQRNQAPVQADTRDFAAILSSRTAETHAVASNTTASKGPDFTNMSRQELSDWVNGQIRSGDMSLDESSAFMGMTMKISAATGQPVDMATDTARIDFTEKARQGIEFARSHFDYAAAERLQDALDMMMQQNRGMDIRI